MATVQIFNSFKEAINEKVHNLATDTLKFMLSNTAPLLTNSIKTDITEIAAGSGYSAGGQTVTVASSSQSGGTYTLVLDDCTVTASGGSIGPFRYLILYNDTAANDELIGYLDYGVSYTLPDGQPFVIAGNTFYSLA